MEIDYLPFTELLSDIIDNRGRTCPTAEFGIPLIATNCIKNDLLYPAFEKVRYVSRETYDTWFRGHPKSGDLIFVTKGTPGRVCITPDPVDFCIAQDMVAVRADIEKIYPKYLFAILRSDEIQNQIENMHVGTLIPHFKKGDFDKLLIPIPDRETQETIGDIYFDFSAKIELNRRMNRTLEAMAQAVFRKWFVDFIPVREKAAGNQPTGMDADAARLFPDRFIDSDWGEIPSGWKFQEIKQLTSNIQYGLTQSASSEQVGPHFLRITDIQGGQVNWNDVPYCIVSPDEYEKYKLLPGDIVVARTGASTGENFYIVDSPDAVFASYLVRFQFEERAVARLVGIFMRTSDYFSYISNNIGGSAQPNANAQVLSGAMMAVPSLEIAKKYLKFVDPLDRMIYANNKESRTLASLRDTLLPKLMRGEVRVK